MKSKKPIWPELLGVLLILFLGLSLWNHSSLPSDMIAILKGSPTPTAIPTGTPSPPANTIHLKLPLEGMAQVESFGDAELPAAGIPAQLLVVVKKSTTVQGGNVLVSYVSEQFCVQVVAFLDKQEAWLPGYDKEEAASVMMALKTNDLVRYGEAVPDQAQIYLVPDSGCGK